MPTNDILIQRKSDLVIKPRDDNTLQEFSLSRLSTVGISDTNPLEKVLYFFGYKTEYFPFKTISKI